MYDLLVDANPNMVVYKKEEIPEHYHYQHNIRIMPVLIEAKEGWTIMQNRTGPFMCTFSHIVEHSQHCSRAHQTGFVSVFKQQLSSCSNNSFTEGLFQSLNQHSGYSCN